jgi:hypothetical protein
MTTRYFLDWAPFASPAVQTHPIKAGTLAPDEIELAKIKTTDILEVAYVLRLDGTYIFAITYKSGALSTDVYWHSTKLSHYLRRITFGMSYLPPFENRLTRLFHTPTHVEDVGAAAYFDRLRKLGVPEEWPGYGAATPSARLLAIADNHIAMAAMRRRTDHELRATHTALLHLKSQMGRRRNIIDTALREHKNFEKRNVPWVLGYSLFALMASVAGLLLLVLVYLIVEPNEVSLSTDLVRFIVHLHTLNRWSWTNILLLALLLAWLTMLWWWYRTAYKPRLHLLNNAAIYFSNCCQYGAVVSRLYERVDKTLQHLGSLKGPFYPHTRSFEGAVEDYKLKLQHEQTRLRDHGIKFTAISIVIGLVVKLGSVLLPP